MRTLQDNNAYNDRYVELHNTWRLQIIWLYHLLGVSDQVGRFGNMKIRDYS